MQELQIGANIARLRKSKGITQEEFANYLGVSKPAVSKWESGQSYPDILLLPVIASYFDKSVDELMDYQPQMSAEDIKKLYIRLADAFAREPFESVHTRCREVLKKYHSCWKLVFAVAELLVNHAARAGSTAQIDAAYEEAAALFERVEKESRDPALARTALSMRAYCSLALQRPADAIDLLGGIEELPISTSQLLAKAYAMKGDIGKARDALQKQLYQNVLALFTTMPDLIALYTDEPDRMDVCLQKALSFRELFQLENLHPASCFSFYLTVAGLYASVGRDERALDLLEAYTDLVTRPGIFPLRLRGNAFFDRLEPYFASLNLGTHVPRSEILIRQDLKTSVAQNPAFRGLQDDKRFRQIVQRLSRWEEDSQ